MFAKRILFFPKHFYIFLNSCQNGDMIMQRYIGFRQNGYRVEVQVPVTIFDDKVAVIRAYQGKNCVGEEYFRLRKLPDWNVPLQAIMLGKSDEKTLERKTDEMMKQLPNLWQ